MTRGNNEFTILIEPGAGLLRHAREQRMTRRFDYAKQVWVNGLAAERLGMIQDAQDSVCREYKAGHISHEQFKRLCEDAERPVAVA